MKSQVQIFKIGMPGMILTAIIMLPVVLAFLILFLIWGLIAQVLLGRSLSRTLRGNTVFTRKIFNPQAAETIRPDIEVTGRTVPESQDSE